MTIVGAIRPRASPPAERQRAAGLSDAEARERLARFGPNVLARSAGPRWWAGFGQNLIHLFALLLWAGAGLAAIAGMPELAIAIVVVILVNAVFSFAQEHRAERAVEALGRVLPQRARVRRDGRPQEVDAGELVPGDVMLLAPGERISADARLLSAVELRVDMSTLTGESRPVRRHTVPTGGDRGLETPDRVFAGTHVFSGSAEAVVTATGMQTELGRIAGLTQRAERRPSPLELEMRRVTRVVALLSVLIGITFFVVAGTLGMPLTDRFLFAIGVIVANVPEGLLPTVTLSLALATQRMARRNAIVRRLSSVETLGCTTVICTDKTGTLTTNEMTVRRLWTPDRIVEVEGVGYRPEGALGACDDAVVDLARAGALCNDATLDEVDGAWRIVGDPTEGALLTLARKAGIDAVRDSHRFPRRGEVPFDSRRKRMTTVHDTPAGRLAYVKGAPALIVARTALADEARTRALAATDDFARDGLRVLAVARRAVDPGTPVSEAIEDDLELLGLVGMQDPPRPEVAAAVHSCREAGIRVVMVTGDHGITAEAIARRIGLVEGRALIVQGDDIDALDDAALVGELARPGALVARVNPEQKLRIAAALHGAGEIVAMTGDGVNDAPALRTADIGIAMGRSGTDVAREAADMVLADDNFASIAAAVEEGRAVYDNIRRFAQYHFSSNVAELLAFLAWGLSGGAIPLPLVVMQVLAIDLGTDLLPAIALGTERPEPGVMQRPPRPHDERLLNRRTLGRVYGFVGLTVGVAGMTAFFFGYLLAGWRPGEPLADTGALYVQATAMTYAGIVAGQVGAGFAFRTARESLVRVGVLSNRFLLVGIAFEIALLLAILNIGPLQEAFHTRALDPLALPLLASVPFVVVAAEEARKAAFRRSGAGYGRRARHEDPDRRRRPARSHARRRPAARRSRRARPRCPAQPATRLPAVLEGRTIHGSPLERAVIEGAVAGCDALAAVSDDDALNAIVGLAARRELQVPVAVAVIANPARAEALAGSGVRVVCPTARTAHELQLTLVRSGIESELDLAGQAAVYRVEPAARLSGRSLAELERRGEFVPVAVERDGRVLLATPELELREGDVLHVAATHRDLLTDLTHP